MVGTTGEPLPNKINSLRKCEGGIGPLKRKCYFERSPHPQSQAASTVEPQGPGQ